jgi:hypothetical protein
VINQNTSGSPDITPNPAIHTDPVAATSSTQPVDPTHIQTGADGVAAGVASNVALALIGVSTGPSGAYAQLQAWGTSTTNATETLSQTVAVNSAQLLAFQNQDAADTNNGINVYLNFTNYANSSSVTGFTERYTGSGTLGISSGTASLLPSGANLTGLAIYNTSPTNTDYQVISAIYSTVPSGSGYNILIGRSDSSMTNYVYAVIAANGYSGLIALHNVQGATDTVVSTTTLPWFYTGSAYSLVCGIEGSLRTYEVNVNGGTALSWIDSSSVTTVGSSNRYCGFGLAQVSSGSPSKVTTFGFVDNAPGPLIGDVCRVFSTATTPVATLSSTATQMFPASFFANTAEQSSNYTYTASTNTITISTSGVYTIKVGVQWVNNGTPTYCYFGTAFYKNGALAEQGDTPSFDISATPPLYFTAADTYSGIALKAGDEIQPAYMSYFQAATNYIIGDTSGESVIFSCALQNTGISG